MFEKANRLQDPKNNIISPGKLILFLGRTCFYLLEVDFCYVAVTKSIISGVYWLQIVIMVLTMLKNVRKSKPFTGF